MASSLKILLAFSRIGDQPVEIQSDPSPECLHDIFLSILSLWSQNILSLITKFLTRLWIDLVVRNFPFCPYIHLISAPWAISHIQSYKAVSNSFPSFPFLFHDFLVAFPST